MYARRLKSRSQKWDSLFQPSKYLIRDQREFSHSQSFSQTTLRGNNHSRGSLIRKFLSDPLLSPGIVSGSSYTEFCGRFNKCWMRGALRFYSSEGDGRNASGDKHVPVKEPTNFDKGKIRKEKVKADVKQCDEHARLGEQDQNEWLNNERLSIESKKRESPFLSRREKFKSEFLRRVVPWEKITVSWETFPYYIHEHTKDLLVECASSHLKHKKFTAAYGARLTSSSGRILLQSTPGTELYRERLVRALARDLKVPLLVLDSSVLAPYDFGEEHTSEYESEDDNTESGEECTSGSEVEDENDASNEEDWASGSEAKSDGSDDDEVEVQASAEALKKLIPYGLEDFEKVRGNWSSTCLSMK